MTVRLRTLDSGETVVSDDRIDTLRAALQGALITPGDPGYDESRAVHNGMFDRRPGLIARCSGTADVIDAVNLARERDLLVAVRGGGHGIAGHCAFDDTLMIDLSAMRAVWVNPAERTVRVQGGATWGDVDRETQVFGLAVPAGVVSTTGVAGLTLGGGLGWLHRKYGLTCDNLLAAEVVTADGALLRVGPDAYVDLFWALRGGGGNFGVVTAFEFRAHPVGPDVMYGAAMYAAEDAPEVFPAWRGWASGLPDEVTSRAMFWSMPASPLLPPEVHGRDVFIAAAVDAETADPDRAARVARLGTPLADLSGPRPLREVNRLMDWLFPKGQLRSYWKSVNVRELDDDVVDVVLRRGLNRPHPATLVHVPQMGGAVQRGGDTAFGDRGAAYIVSIDGNWTDAADTEANVRWVREAADEVRALPSAGGSYLNFEADAGHGAFGGNIDRLSRVKRQYDPGNRFRLNANIQPAG